MPKTDNIMFELLDLVITYSEQMDRKFLSTLCMYKHIKRNVGQQLGVHKEIERLEY
jgi:hypothetical protein